MAARGFDQIPLPTTTGCIVLDAEAEEADICREGGGGIEIALFGGPAKCCTEIGEFGGEPQIRLALAWAVPQRQDVGLAIGEIDAHAAI